uniref:Importin-4 n=1 Tax=Rhizophora mucronata TaxID=61149 RepID=A0A2P2KVA3_RHIMU
MIFLCTLTALEQERQQIRPLPCWNSIFGNNTHNICTRSPHWRTVLHGDALDEGLLDEVLELGRELGPVAGDLLAEEDGGQLADVGGLGGAEVLEKGGDHLGILSQPLYLLLGLPPGVVVRHQKLY